MRQAATVARPMPAARSRPALTETVTGPACVINTKGRVFAARVATRMFSPSQTSASAVTTDPRVPCAASERTNTER